MQITSLEFLVFFGASFLAYYVMPVKGRWCVLLAFSVMYYLCCATPYTILYLLLTVVTCYLASNYFEKVRSSAKFSGEMPRQASWILAGAILINFGFLAALKYMNFIIFNMNGIVSIFSGTTELPYVDWPASLGISYYTLQMTGYLCDSYWGGFQPKRTFSNYSYLEVIFRRWLQGQSAVIKSLQDSYIQAIL